MDGPSSSQRLIVPDHITRHPGVHRRTASLGLQSLLAFAGTFRKTFPLYMSLSLVRLLPPAASQDSCSDAA